MAKFIDKDTDKVLSDRMKELPKVVQDAITSANVEQQLRKLSNERKLHLDQWESLENEVMLVLLGFQPVEKLEENIKKELNVSTDVAADLTAEISRIVFEPIRQQLERELEHPEAKAAPTSGVEAARARELKDATAESPPAPTAPATPPAPPVPPVPMVVPGTPPPPPPSGKATRMPSSGAYQPGVPSHERKDIHDDPYREPPA